MKQGEMLLPVWEKTKCHTQTGKTLRAHRHTQTHTDTHTHACVWHFTVQRMGRAKHSLSTCTNTHHQPAAESLLRKVTESATSPRFYFSNPAFQSKSLYRQTPTVVLTIPVRSSKRGGGRKNKERKKISNTLTQIFFFFLHVHTWFQCSPADQAAFRHLRHAHARSHSDNL